MAIRVLGRDSEERTEALRMAMLYAHSNFATYRRGFSDAGLSRNDIARLDPLSMLQRLPVLEGPRFQDVANEGFVATDHVIDVETSSGTTGTRKRRAITPRDAEEETRLLVRLFQVCGIGPSDSVACLDTGPLTLMVSFTEAFERLGVPEAYAYCASPVVDTTIEGLASLGPTVIVTIPSIVDRYLPAMVDRLGGLGGSRLRAVVYVGEAMSEETRSVLQDKMGVEVFSYYGASETSALGIECGAHDGVHLFTDQNIIELIDEGAASSLGEVLVTTLHQEGLPLLRYALRDLVNVKDGGCGCGLRYPRVEVVGRVDGSASVLGVKVSYDAIQQAAYRVIGEPGPMKVVLDRDGREHMTIVLPDRLREREPAIRKSVLASETELAYLTGSRFLELHLSFVDDGHFQTRKRADSIVDRRETVSAGR